MPAQRSANRGLALAASSRCCRSSERCSSAVIASAPAFASSSASAATSASLPVDVDPSGFGLEPHQVGGDRS